MTFPKLKSEDFGNLSKRQFTQLRQLAYTYRSIDSAMQIVNNDGYAEEERATAELLAQKRTRLYSFLRDQADGVVLESFGKITNAAESS